MEVAELNYLLDTNHWSYLQRGHPNVVARVRQLPEGASLYMPVVSQAELLAGVELLPAGSRRDELQRLYAQAVSGCTEVLPIDSPVAEQFATIVSHLQHIGRPIDTNDVWIAAIAKVHDLTVVSNDAHFGAIQDLRVEDWTRHD